MHILLSTYTHANTVIQQDLVNSLLTRPVTRIYKQVEEAKESEPDPKNAQSPDIARTILIVQGIRDADQAKEIYVTVRLLQRRLKDPCWSLSIVIISDPKFLRHLDDEYSNLFKYVCTMHVSNTGSTLYSGITSPSRELQEVYGIELSFCP